MFMYPFVVVQRALCVYGRDLPAASLEFLDGIDIGYFRYVAEIQTNTLDQIDPSNPGRPKRQRTPEEHATQYAAISLRMAYAQALETFFALLGAAVQAPHMPMAWVTEYKPRELPEFVRLVNARGLKYWRTSENPTWDHLAAWCLPIQLPEEKGGAERVQKIHRAFGRLWNRFANDFLDKSARTEYNSLKHGLRARPGGFFLSIGLESEPGVAAPPEAMSPLSGSQFGTHYFELEGIVGAPKYCLTFARTGRNWSPDALRVGLILLALSIENIIGRLAIESGRPGTEVKFQWIDDEETLNAPWKHGTGFHNMTFRDSLKNDAAIPFPSVEEIHASYDRENQSS